MGREERGERRDIEEKTRIGKTLRPLISSAFHAEGGDPCGLSFFKTHISEFS